MYRTKIVVYIEVLRDVFQNFEGPENFIKQGIEEICERKQRIKKISVEEIFYLFYFFKVFY